MIHFQFKKKIHKMNYKEKENFQKRKKMKLKCRRKKMKRNNYKFRKMILIYYEK